MLNKISAEKIVFTLILFFLSLYTAGFCYESNYIVIKGGIIPDYYSKDNSVNYISGKVIVIKDKKILAVTDEFDTLRLSGNIKEIDARGKYIIPGLTEGFGAINNQSYANAYLYMGITSLIAVDGGRRGPFYGKGKPSPAIYRLESVGDDKKSTKEHINDLRNLYRKGYKIVLLKYALGTRQVKACVNEANKLGMATIGELGYTTYEEGCLAGVDAFVHTTRYSLDVAPRNMAGAVADHPFSDDLSSPKWKYYTFLSKLKMNYPPLLKHAKVLGKCGTFLMPTMSLSYLDTPDHKNPWLEPVSIILDPKDINNPADKISGNHIYKKEIQEAYSNLIRNEKKIEKIYQKNGAHYLAGSATDVWGTMPGISLHTELNLLNGIGLSRKEVISAATVNFHKAFGWKRGKIERGYFADILILNSNPFENLENLKDIDLIFSGGKIINREKLLVKKKYDNGEIVDSAYFSPLLFKDVKNMVLKDDGNLKTKYDYLNDVVIKKIHYYSDGLKVTAYLSYPEKIGKYPCIIYNRGGNREFGKITPKKVALILARVASWGYVVAGSQYRGNDGGEGREEFGGKDVNDVMNLFPVFEKIPGAVLKNIGIYGWSRGGMMTYLTLMRTDRISAAVIGGGLADLLMMKENRPDMEKYVYGELMPGYYENREKYLFERSAIQNVGKISKKAPVLLLHGTADWRVKPEQSILMAKEMIKEKIPFRLVMFEGGDHGLTEFTGEVDLMVKRWFDKFLKAGKPLPVLKAHGK